MNAGDFMFNGLNLHFVDEVRRFQLVNQMLTRTRRQNEQRLCESETDLLCYARNN